MNRFSLISPLFILSLIFAFDDNVKVKKEPQKQEQIVSHNDIPIPIDVDNLQYIRTTDQFKERTLEYNARLKRGESLKKNFKIDGENINAIDFSDIKKKMNTKREIDKRRKNNKIPNLQDQISRSFHMPQKTKIFGEEQLRRKNLLRQKYQIENNSTNRNIPRNLYPGQGNNRDEYWFETFDTDASTGADLTFTSDYTWSWWGWGTAEVSDGTLNLTGALDPWSEITNWVQIDENIDPDIEIDPTNALIVARVKFSTIATQPHDDYFHFSVAIDPNFLTNYNLYTMYASPSEGVIGSYYWQEGSWDSVSTSEVIYDQYFWQILAVDGDNAYVWALPDTATYIPEEPDYMFTINNVTDIVEPIETLLLVAHTSSDSSSVHIDHVYYGLYNFVDDNDEFEYAGSFGESDYYISTNVDTNWYAAEEMSSNVGGHLVSITSEEENDFIHSITEQYGLNEAWIGFTDETTEGDWEWTTGEDVVFTNWAEGEPNDSGGEDCAEIWYEGTWNDAPCEWDIPFIMEVDSYIDLEYSNFTIELNGEEDTDLAVGNELVVTITFDSSASEPNAGLMHIVYDFNMDSELSDTDFVILGDIIIVDNDDYDENPAVGIVQATIDPDNPDDGNEQDLVFWLTMQNTTWFFASVDFDSGGYFDVATLDVTGWNPPGIGNSISGNVDPATPNLLSWAWGQDTYYYPHAAMTDANGEYEMDTGEGQYDLYMFDIFGLLGPNMFISPYYQSVNVDGGITDVNFEIMELSTMVFGWVADENGDPVVNAGINFWNDSLGVYASGWTNESGYYETWALGDHYYFLDVYAEGFYGLYQDSIYIEDRDNFQYDIFLESFGDVNSVIHGYVYDMNGQTIPDAYVEAWSDELGYGVSTQPDENGWYELDLIGGYNYYVYAWMEGLVSSNTEFVFAQENESIWIDFYLADPWYEAPPDILYAGDVPNDQGRQMRLVWSSGQPGYWMYFTQYSIWRHVPEAPEELWDYVTTVPWRGMGMYSTVVPTLGDSTADGIYWSTFMVTAHTEDPNYFLDSWPGVGYSIDNLPPGVPTGFTAAIEGSGIELAWDNSLDEDFQYFRLDKSSDENFSSYQSIHTINTTYMDTEYEVGVTQYYRISAIDHSGNMGEFSPTLDMTLMWTDLDNTIPNEYTLHQNYPNPFNPSTTLRYALPKQSEIKITIYDMIGRKVRTLVNSSQNAGYRSVIWDATDDNGKPVSAGIYLYQIQADEYINTKKMVLLK